MTTAPMTFRALARGAAQDSSAVRTAPQVSVWPHALVTGVGAFFAIGTLAFVHLLTFASVDAVAEPLSQYGLSARSFALFALSCLALAVAAVALAPRLSLLGRVSAYAGAIMLVLVVVFPTDPGTGTLSMTAQIHRYAAGAAFVLLAVLMLSAAAHCGPAMRRSIWVSLVIVVLMLALTIAATFWPELWAMQQWRGVPQRVLLLTQAATIGAVGLHLHQARGRRQQWGA